MPKRKTLSENKENEYHQSPVKLKRNNESFLGENTNKSDATTSNEILKDKQDNADQSLSIENKENIPKTSQSPKQIHTRILDINEQVDAAPLTRKDAAKKNNFKNENKNDFVENVKLLKSILKNTIKSGDFAVSGEATELPTQIGLFIKNLGIVSTPITNHTANDIIKISTQAPYGLNEKTLINKDVRDSYQINPDEIEIKNPEWNAKLNLLVRRVSKSLGCENKNVHAKLYKMLLYEKGGHFVKHRDTEKEKNMFATLVLQLPSIYEGGQFNVYHNGKKKTFDFGQSTEKAPYSVHFTAHYADIEHEVLEIKSGYRLVLVYSLCSGDEQFAMINSNEATDRLSELLLKMNQFSKPIGVLLEHQYTHESLSKNGCKALKGLDMDYYNLLKSASDKLEPKDQLCFYIVNVDYIMEQFGYDEEYYKYSDLEKNAKKLRKDKKDIEIESNESSDDKSDFENGEENAVSKSKKIGKWYDPTGKPFLSKSHYENFDLPFKFFSSIIDTNSDLSYGDFIKTWKFINVDVEYTGNEGSTLTTQYRRYLLTFWPKKQEFQIQTRISVEKATYILRESLDKIATKRNEFIENLKHLLNGLNDSLIQRTYRNEEIYKKICEMLEALKEDDLYKLFLDKLAEEKALCSLNTIYTLKSKHGLDSNLFKPLLIKYMKECGNEDEYVKMLKELNDLDTIKLYVEQKITNCNLSWSIDKQGFNLAVKMYKSFPLNEHELFYNAKLEPEYTVKYCQVACALKLKDIKLANDFLKNKIIKLLDNPDEFEKLDKEHIRSFHERQNFYSLAETLILFEKEDELIKFKDLILKSQDNDSLTRFLKEIANQGKPNFKLFNSSKPILDLFIHQLKWLDEKIRNFKFEHPMPEAKIYGHSDVEEFLKSDRAEMNYNGSDTSRGYLNKSDAECFVRSENGLQSGHSVSMSIQKQPNSSSRYLVKIVKTNKLYEKQLNDLKNDNDILKSFVLAFVKTKYNK